MSKADFDLALGLLKLDVGQNTENIKVVSSELGDCMGQQEGADRVLAELQAAAQAHDVNQAVAEGSLAAMEGSLRESQAAHQAAVNGLKVEVEAQAAVLGLEMEDKEARLRAEVQGLCSELCRNRLDAADSRLGRTLETQLAALEGRLLPFLDRSARAHSLAPSSSTAACTGRSAALDSRAWLLTAVLGRSLLFRLEELQAFQAEATAAFDELQGADGADGRDGADHACPAIDELETFRQEVRRGAWAQRTRGRS